jgi:hypothetical protein
MDARTTSAQTHLRRKFTSRMRLREHAVTIRLAVGLGGDKQKLLVRFYHAVGDSPILQTI